LGLPLLAAVASAVVLRKVTIGPFGVVRRARRQRPPWPWPGILIAVGMATFFGLSTLTRASGEADWTVLSWIIPVQLFGGAFLTALGVVLGAGWITYTTGRLLRRLARRPAPLLAASRLMADPWSSSRNFAALLTCVLFAAGAAGFRSAILTDIAVNEEANRLQAQAEGRPFEAWPRDAFYTQTMDLINLAIGIAMLIAAAGLLVAIVESIVTSRRAYASLVATGVSRTVLGRSVLWQSLAPALPAIFLALAVGVALPRGVWSESRNGGYEIQVCTAAEEICADPTARLPHLTTVQIPAVVRQVPIPYDHLAIAGAAATVAILATVAVALLFLRRSTDIEELRTT
jgi:hypothetical protein